MANILDKAVNGVSGAVTGAVGQVTGFVSGVIDGVTQSVSGLLGDTETADTNAFTEGKTTLQYPLHDLNGAEMFVTFQTIDRPAFEHDDAVQQQQTEEKDFGRAASSQRGIVKDIKDISNDVADWYNAPNPLPKFQAEPVGKEIRLQMPQAIQFADGMAYNNFSLGIIGAGLSNTVAAAGDINLAKLTFEGLAKGVEGLIEGITSNLDTEASALAAQRVANKMNQTLGGAIASATGTTINPHNRTLFEGVNTRAFGFQFVMIASSAEEAKMVRDIIKHFRVSMYPKDIYLQNVDGSGDFGPAIGFKFPRKFKIRFWDAKLQKEANMEKIRDCYLTNFSVTYNSGDATFHSDGEPTSVEISMQFMEDRPLSRQMVEEMYGDVHDEMTDEKLEYELGDITDASSFAPKPPKLPTTL